MTKNQSSGSGNPVDGYIQGFDGIVRERLEQMRAILKEALPQAEEIISYQMPAYRWHENLLYFAAAKHHIGLYPTSSGIRAFEGEFQGWKHSKGAVQFPLEVDLPRDLIARIAAFRRNEVAQKRNLD